MIDLPDVVQGLLVLATAAWLAAHPVLPVPHLPLPPLRAFLDATACDPETLAGCVMDLRGP